MALLSSMHLDNAVKQNEAHVIVYCNQTKACIDTMDELERKYQKQELNKLLADSFFYNLLDVTVWLDKNLESIVQETRGRRLFLTEVVNTLINDQIQRRLDTTQ